MQQWLVQLGIELGLALGVVACMLIGPFLGLGMLSFRKRRERRLRKAAVATDLLRSPGQALREQVEDCRLDLFSDVMLLSWIPMLLLSFYLAQLAFGRPLRTTAGVVLFVLLGVIGLGILVWRVWGTSRRLDRLRTGYDAETAVGQELDQLMRHGAFVFHDVPADGFNIDHVVVANEGVFAIETKGYTKPNRGQGKTDATVAFDGQTLKFPTWTTSDPIEQAERQSIWLARWLTDAIAQPVQALPVLALPGWYVERNGRGGVRVFNGRELAGLLRARGAQPLNSQDVERIAHQLERRCRNVVPTFHRSHKPS